jgi:hypothetical protein
VDLIYGLMGFLVCHVEVSKIGGIPLLLDGLCGNILFKKIDDNWQYPYFRKPPGFSTTSLVLHLWWFG